MSLTQNDLRVIIFGAGDYGTKYLNKMETVASEVIFSDNDEHLWGGVMGGFPIIPPYEILNHQFDKLAIANAVPEVCESIKHQLMKYGVPVDKIEIFSYYGPQIAQNEVIYLRNSSLRMIAKYIHEQKIMGSAAELGVYQGGFARYINRYFYDRKLYLFDTFDGFSQSDIDYERAIGDQNFTEGTYNHVGRFDDTSVQRVMKHMLFPENIVIRKGLFPETSEGIIDTFAFVSLDADLYKPMLEGLRFFWPQMTQGGVILCHDYYTPDLPGTKSAIETFESSLGMFIPKLPLNDECSMALIKI